MPGMRQQGVSVRSNNGQIWRTVVQIPVDMSQLIKRANSQFYYARFRVNGKDRPMVVALRG